MYCENKPGDTWRLKLPNMQSLIHNLKTPVFQETCCIYLLAFSKYSTFNAILIM